MNYTTLLICLLLLHPYHTSVAEEPDWGLYNALLKEHTSVEKRRGVTLTWINYSALKKSGQFNALLSMLESYPLSKLTTPE